MCRTPVTTTVMIVMAALALAMLTRWQPLIQNGARREGRPGWTKRPGQATPMYADAASSFEEPFAARRERRSVANGR